MRQRCPVAHSEFFGYSFFATTMYFRILADHETFSNAVSQHLSVPGGMDPPEHTPFGKSSSPTSAIGLTVPVGDSKCVRLHCPARLDTNIYHDVAIILGDATFDVAAFAIPCEHPLITTY